MVTDYGQLDKVVTQNDGSSLFERYATPDPKSHASTAEKLGQVQWRIYPKISLVSKIFLGPARAIRGHAPLENF